MTPTEVRSARTFKSVVFFQTRLVSFVVEEQRRTNLSGSRFSHQGSQLPRDYITGNIVQQFSLLSPSNGDRIVQSLPREGICHLLSGSQSLLRTCTITTKVSDRIRSGRSALLYIASLRSRGRGLFGSTLECDDGSSFSEFRLELGDDEINCKENGTKSANDTEVLDKAM